MNHVNNAARRRVMPGCFYFGRGAAWLLALSIVALTGCQDVFYYPDQKERGTPANARLTFEDVYFSAKDGSKLHGWFMPAASGGPARGTVLHVHGNAGNVSCHYQAVSWLPKAGYNVLTFDYRGFGRSEGNVTREGTIQDACAALDYLRGRKDVDVKRVFVIGQSIGAAVAIVLTAERGDQIRGLVADSGFSSYRDIARYHIVRNPALLIAGWWYPFTIGHAYDPGDYVGRIRDVPILFIHGKADRVVPWQMSQALYDKAVAPKELWLIDGIDHYEVWETRADEAQARVLKFFESCTSKSRA